jgi:hypothetical protein
VLSAIYIGDRATYYGGVNSCRLSSYRWYIIPNDILPIENKETTSTDRARYDIPAPGKVAPAGKVARWALCLYFGKLL